MVDITPVHYEGEPEVAADTKVEVVEREKGKEEKQPKEPKAKKEVKVKVKQVK
jgi:hypothetical protein